MIIKDGTMEHLQLAVNNIDILLDFITIKDQM